MHEIDPKNLQQIAPLLERVLIVEPVQASARLLAELLRNIAPCHVWVAATTERALEITKMGDPRLIFTEFTGEGTDGLAFVRALRRSSFACRKAPVIMITAQATPTSILGARDAGVHEFLRKPYTNKDLVRRLEAVALAPRGWVEAVGYVGPDRRRFNSAEFKGARKRKADTAPTNPLQADIEQAIRIVLAAVPAIGSDPNQAFRALSTQAVELKKAAIAGGNAALASAAGELQRYLASAGSGEAITQSAMRPHVERLSAFLPRGSAARAA